MKALFAIALLAFVILACTPNNSTNNPVNSKDNTGSIKDKFIGTWELRNPSEAGVDSLTFIFKNDNTYEAHEVENGKKLDKTGSYEIRGERLYLTDKDGQRDIKDGFKLESDGSMSANAGGRNCVFNKR